MTCLLRPDRNYLSPLMHNLFFAFLSLDFEVLEMSYEIGQLGDDLRS